MLMPVELFLLWNFPKRAINTVLMALELTGSSNSEFSLKTHLHDQLKKRINHYGGYLPKCAKHNVKILYSI